MKLASAHRTLSRLATSINYSILLRIVKTHFNFHFTQRLQEPQKASNRLLFSLESLLLYHIFTLCTQFSVTSTSPAIFSLLEMILFALFHFSVPCYSVENEKIKNLCIHYAAFVLQFFSMLCLHTSPIAHFC